MFNTIVNWFLGVFEDFLGVVLDVLPTSPFTSYIEALNSLPYLQYLNWFVPVGQIIAVGELWLVAVGLFYLYSIVMRWIRAIE